MLSFEYERNTLIRAGTGIQGALGNNPGVLDFQMDSSDDVVLVDLQKC